MCRYCDYHSDNCKIFIEWPAGDWYLELEAPSKNEPIYARDYIAFCPYCGEQLKDVK